jgi:hypothetical protein
MPMVKIVKRLVREKARTVEAAAEPGTVGHGHGRAALVPLADPTRGYGVR